MNPRAGTFRSCFRVLVACRQSCGILREMGVGVKRFELDGDEYVVVAIPLVAAPDPRLTPAERGVVDDVLRGLSNEAIGASRGVSKHTVAAHLRSIYKKLAVGSRRELAASVARATAEPRRD